MRAYRNLFPPPPRLCWLAALLPLALGCGGSSAPQTESGEIPAYARIVALDTVIPPSGEGYDLYDARHVRTLSDDRIVVLNSGTQEVLIFSPSGTLVDRFGGPGEGPGEFSIPWFMTVLPGDSILVTDRPPPQRTVVFTSDGEVARTFSFETPETGSWYVLPEGVTDDGRIVAGHAIELPPPGTPPGLHRELLSLVVYDSGGHLLEYVSRESVAHEFWLVEVDGRIRSMSPPLLGRGLIAVGGPGIVMGRARSPDVLWIGSDGRTRDTIATAFRGSALSEAVLDSTRQAWAEEHPTEDGRLRRRRELTEMPAPDAAPVIAEIQVDRDGRLWVAESMVTGDRSTTWLVYTGDSLLGRVDIPADLEVREIGTGHVLGIRSDSLDVETVVRLRLDRR